MSVYHIKVALLDNINVNTNANTLSAAHKELWAAVLVRTLCDALGGPFALQADIRDARVWLREREEGNTAYPTGSLMWILDAFNLSYSQRQSLFRELDRLLLLSKEDQRIVAKEILSRNKGRKPDNVEVQEDMS